MKDKQITLQRLAIIKYLFKIGIEQSYQVEPLASFSILSFHDSIEMFLKYLAEKKNIKSDNFSFLDYWTHIPTLTLKESMRNLNSRRVNIKHKGILPSKTDIEISRVNATDFFKENMFPHFNVEFDNISLFDLIVYEEVKNELEKAQKALSAKNNEESIKHSTLAFHSLLHLYENNKQGNYRYSPFFFGKDLTFNSSFSMHIEDRKMAEFVDNVKDSIEVMQKAIKIMSLGIDYKRYVKFNLLTPHITRTFGGIVFSANNADIKWTDENCQYCIDFVLDSSLKLQEFDFDIEELQTLRWKR